MSEETHLKAKTIIGTMDRLVAMNAQIQWQLKDDVEWPERIGDLGSDNKSWKQQTNELTDDVFEQKMIAAMREVFMPMRQWLTLGDSKPQYHGDANDNQEMANLYQLATNWGMTSVQIAEISGRTVNYINKSGSAFKLEKYNQSVYVFDPWSIDTQKVR
jgi:hypothetical protein